MNLFLYELFLLKLIEIWNLTFFNISRLEASRRNARLEQADSSDDSDDDAVMIVPATNSGMLNGKMTNSKHNITSSYSASETTSTTGLKFHSFLGLYVNYWLIFHIICYNE